MHRSKEKRKRKYTKEDQDVYMAVEYTLDGANAVTVL